MFEQGDDRCTFVPACRSAYRGAFLDIRFRGRSVVGPEASEQGHGGDPDLHQGVSAHRRRGAGQ
jgi:hypothetical protein